MTIIVILTCSPLMIKFISNVPQEIETEQKSSKQCREMEAGGDEFAVSVPVFYVTHVCFQFDHCCIIGVVITTTVTVTFSLLFMAMATASILFFQLMTVLKTT